jgi:hypothetical protein
MERFLLALAGALVIGLAGLAMAQRVASSTDLDAAPQALDPAKRHQMVLPFGSGFWRPVSGEAVVSLPDDQMTVVGLNEATRIYAPAGGGGGRRQGWQAGEVYIRVGAGKYLALKPTNQPRQPETLGPSPALRDAPGPVPQR